MFSEKINKLMNELEKDDLETLIKLFISIYSRWDRTIPTFEKNSISGKVMGLLLSITNIVSNVENPGKAAFLRKFFDDYLKDPIPFETIEEVINHAFPTKVTVAEILSHCFVSEEQFIQNFKNNKRFSLEEFRKKCTVNNPKIKESVAIKLVQKINGKPKVRKTKEESLNDPINRNLTRIEDFTDDELEKYSRKFNWMRVYKSREDDLKKRKHIFKSALSKNSDEYFQEQLLGMILGVIPYDDFKTKAKFYIQTTKTKFNTSGIYGETDLLGKLFFIFAGVTVFEKERLADAELREILRDAITLMLAYTYFNGYPCIFEENREDLDCVRQRFERMFSMWSDTDHLFEFEKAISNTFKNNDFYKYGNQYIADRFEELCVEMKAVYPEMLPFEIRYRSISLPSSRGAWNECKKMLDRMLAI